MAFCQHLLLLSVPEIAALRFHFQQEAQQKLLKGKETNTQREVTAKQKKINKKDENILKRRYRVEKIMFMSADGIGKKVK